MYAFLTGLPELSPIFCNDAGGGKGAVKAAEARVSLWRRRQNRPLTPKATA